MQVLVRSFLFTPDAIFSEGFRLMLVLVRSFSYTARAGFSEESV